MNVGTLIREVREDRDETMAEFAAHLGLRHTAISRYESGKLTPSASVLLNIYRLSRKANHKLAIKALLGEGSAILDKEDKLQVQAARVKAELDEIITGLKKSPDVARRFSELAVAVVSDPEGVPLWLCELIRVWLRVKGDPDARREFEDLAHRAVMKAGHRASRGGI